jgi:hypothetical protein
MKAYLIDAEKQAIENIDVSNMDDIIELIGFDTIASDAVGNNGDRLFFDEECFIRGTTGRFQIDTVIPVSGKGVLVSASEDGTSLSDVQTDLDDLRNRTKYL